MTIDKQSAPTWATAVFRQTLVQFERLSQTLHLAMRGISFAQHSHRIAELVTRIEGDSGEKVEGRLKQAEEEAELAKREVEEGFPVIHAQAVVTLWAYLEACVRQLVAVWIQNDPSCLRNSAFEKVRVRLAEYERLDQTEKPYFIVDALERELAAGLQNGLTRFEPLLAALELAGPVPGVLGRLVYELAQVRNVILHRGGIVDKRFVDACPWKKLRAADPLLVTHDDYETYNRAVHDYFMIIICRVGERFGVNVASERAEILARYEGMESQHGTERPSKGVAPDDRSPSAPARR